MASCVESPVGNKPIAFMGAEVKTQTSVFRKNISDYPHFSTMNPPRKQLPKRWLQVGGLCGMLARILIDNYKIKNNDIKKD